MHYLTALSQVPREIWIAAGGGAAIAILAVLILFRGGRRRYVLVASSPATEMFAYQLARVADSLERIALAGVSVARQLPQAKTQAQPARREPEPEPQAEPEPATTVTSSREAKPAPHIALSMFGR
jgi:hypothetical protein